MLPLTRDIPKPLLRIGNQTILDYIFDALPEGVDTVIMVVGYLENRIKMYLGAISREKYTLYSPRRAFRYGDGAINNQRVI